VAPEERADLERLAQYIIRNPFAVEKIQGTAGSVCLFPATGTRNRRLWAGRGVSYSHFGRMEGGCPASVFRR
jgi:hypothetical protein